MTEEKKDEKKIFERLSMFTSALAGKPIHVTSQKVLPASIRKLAPKMALTDGSRIYLPELELDEKAREETYKTYCLEKFIEMQEGQLSLPENERPNFEEFKNPTVAFALFQALENEQYKNRSEQRFFHQRENKQNNSFLKNFLEVAKNLPEKQAKKLRKYASRYSRIAQQGKGNMETSMQYTQRIYDLLNFSQEEQAQSELPDSLQSFFSQFGIPVGKDGMSSLTKSLEAIAMARDKLISRITEDEDTERSELEEALDEEIEFNGELVGEYTSSSVEKVKRKLKGNYQDKRIYVPNPHANPNQEKDLKFVEIDLNSNRDPALYDVIKKQYSAQIARLQKLFERLKGENYRKIKRQVSGSDIDLDAAIDFMVSLKNGEQPEDKVYTDVKRNRRDVCSGILIDMSGSMHGEKIKRAKETITQISESLDYIKDNFAIIGFSGNHPTVNIYRIKGFEQKFDAGIRSRISDVEAQNNNRDGAAIRYMTDYILQMPNRTKILFVVSDGSPADGNYGDAIKDTRESILEARAKGIRTFCITVDANAESYIRELYGNTPFCICPNPEELPEKAGRFYQQVAF